MSASVKLSMPSGHTILSMLQATSDPMDFEAYNRAKEKEYFRSLNQSLVSNRSRCFSRTEKESEIDESIHYIQKLFDESQQVSQLRNSASFDQRKTGPFDDQSGSKNRVETSLSNEYLIPFIAATVAIAYLARYFYFQTLDL